jgi:signal transduction histidine kinase/CheY-like chemotaxis protein
MLDSLLPRKTASSPDATTQLRDLRSDALRFFLAGVSAGYLAWHFHSAVYVASGEVAAVYTIAAIAVPVLAASYLLSLRHPDWASWVFVGGVFLSITWAIVVLESAEPASLYAVLALIAAFVLGPLVGFAVAGGSVTVLVLLSGARPGALSDATIWYVALFAGLAVAGVWILTHHLLLALNWYADSYARAEHRTREAEEHRAQLVQAWKQLDTAYYRLERANAALQHAWKAADEAERSKMELATNISHELRTPLNLIVGYSEMMMTSPGSYVGETLPPAYRVDLNAIYRSAQHLLALTDDVLDLARLEVGHLGLNREQVDLGQLALEAVALVRDYVEAKGLELRFRVPRDLPVVMSDRLRIRQVLLNILINAARLTEIGWIAVEVERLDDVLRVSVTDTGPGIAPENLARVFQRFFTRGPTAPGEHAGTGLGLPLSKRFIEMHGGDMGVHSKVGEGTTFWFTLPLSAAGTQVLSGERRGLPPSYARPYEQMLVLAHPEERLAHLLQRHFDGYRVETAPDLSHATIRALELRAVAVIAEPDAAGDAGPVPVVRCALPSVGQMAARLGVADYLIKPVSRETLLRSIDGLGVPIERVLIVDDDARFTELLARMLGSDGRHYQTAVAHNGEEALAKMSTQRPDLVLLDMAMPGLDGVGVLDQMRGTPDLADVNVVVVSAQGEAEGIVSLGEELTISKPGGFRIAELTQVIAAAVSKLTPARAYLADTVLEPQGEQSG